MVSNYSSGKAHFSKPNNALEINFILSKKGKPLPIEAKANDNKEKSLGVILK